jgi:hypothetical protein
MSKRRFSMRASRASGSTLRKIEQIILEGERATKRALSSNYRRALAERLANEN